MCNWKLLLTYKNNESSVPFYQSTELCQDLLYVVMYTSIIFWSCCETYCNDLASSTGGVSMCPSSPYMDTALHIFASFCEQWSLKWSDIIMMFITVRSLVSIKSPSTACIVIKNNLFSQGIFNFSNIYCYPSISIKIFNKLQRLSLYNI